MAEELAIAESVRGAVRSAAAYLATTVPVQAQIAAAHAQLMAAFSKEMADADGEMLAEYGAMDAMEPLPQETVGRELDMEAAAEIDEHQPYQVTSGFRDSDIQPVRSRSRRHTRFATLRPSGS